MKTIWQPKQFKHLISFDTQLLQSLCKYTLTLKMLFSPVDRCSTAEVERQSRVVDCMLSAIEGLWVKIDVMTTCWGHQITLCLSPCQSPFLDKAALRLEKQRGSTLPSQSLLGHDTLTERHTVRSFEVVTAWSWPDVTLVVSVALVIQYNKRLTKNWDPECQATLFFLKLYHFTEDNPTATGFLQSRDQVGAQKPLLL